MQPSISRDSILTIDDFETADKQTDEVEESVDNFETATEDSELLKEVRSRRDYYQRNWRPLSLLKALVKEKDAKDEEDPVRAWMCAIKIQWLCQAGTN